MLPQQKVLNNIKVDLIPPFVTSPPLWTVEPIWSPWLGRWLKLSLQKKWTIACITCLSLYQPNSSANSTAGARSWLAWPGSFPACSATFLAGWDRTSPRSMESGWGELMLVLSENWHYACGSKKTHVMHTQATQPLLIKFNYLPFCHFTSL